ncbi:hypothetical protein FC752_06035 [Lysinibacillus varians]|uniref:Collagen-like protein n=2 Tax=Lysinibacillus varians TaxID=1145276 RepID=A0ABY2TCU8_9BACI|nr:hypothetical protein FC752_06035 [Lysinibacillus varians]
MGGTGGNIPASEAKGGTNSTFTGTANVAGLGGVGGQGSPYTNHTTMTTNGVTYEKTINLLPNMYVCNITSNSGSNAGSNGNNGGGNVGIGGTPMSFANNASVERILINNYIRLFYSLPNENTGLGGTGGKGGNGGIGVSIQGIPGGNGEKGQDGTAGNSGLLLIEWG